MEIVETDKYGLANTIDNVIYLHPRLKDFPEIREKVLKHEIEHYQSKGFLRNRKIDAFTELKFRDLFPFYKKNPKVFFKQHSPITYIDKTIYFEWSLIILYTLFAGLLFLIYSLIKLFSKDSVLFWKIVSNLFWVSLIITVIYFGGKRLLRYLNEDNEEESVA